MAGLGDMKGLGSALPDRGGGKKKADPEADGGPDITELNLDQVADGLWPRLLEFYEAKEAKVGAELMRQYERRVLHEKAYGAMVLWWYKINPHRSYVKGWKIAPSHYLNQGLDNIWLDK